MAILGADLSVVLICAGLCIVGVILVFVLPVVMDLLGVIINLTEIALDIVGMGPGGWCGCLVIIAALGLCAGTLLLTANLLSTCGTPDAVNLCRLLP